MGGRFKRQKKLVPTIIKEVGKAYDTVGHAVIAAPIEKALGAKKGKWFHDNVWLEERGLTGVLPEFVDDLKKEMNGQKSFRKGKKKRHAQFAALAAPSGGMVAVQRAPRGRKGKKATRGRQKKRAYGGRKGLISAFTRAPGRRNTKVNTVAGLTMRQGTVEGRTELLPSLVIDGSASPSQNVQGYVLYQAAITPQTIAPGTRFAKLSALYDQYTFSDLQLEVKPDIAFTINGMLIGGYESDVLDPLPPVGGILNVTKYMEHSSFHAESVANRTSLVFPQEKKAVSKFGKGPRAGYFSNRLPAVSSQLATTNQGQLVIAVHTPVADSNGVSANAISLGPLILHWKLKLKEAAELNEIEGTEDFYIVNSGNVANPLNFSNTYKVQSGLNSTSDLLFKSQYGAPSTYFWELPIGQYEFDLAVNYSITGVAVPQWVAAAAAPGIVFMNSYGSQAITSSTFQTQIVIARVNVTTAGSYQIWGISGTNTGCSYLSANARVSLLPSGATSLLRHPSYVVRSLAFCRLRDTTQQSLVEDEVKKQLRDAGVITKEEKKTPLCTAYDEKILVAINEHNSELEVKKKKPKALEIEDYALDDDQMAKLVRQERFRKRLMDGKGWEDDDFGPNPELDRYGEFAGFRASELKRLDREFDQKWPKPSDDEYAADIAEQRTRLIRERKELKIEIPTPGNSRKSSKKGD